MHAAHVPPVEPLVPPPPGPDGRRGGRGCFTALAVLGGLVVVVALVGFAVAWRFGLLRKMGLGAKLAYESSRAPGAAELKAVGCDTVMILNADDLGELVGKTGPHDQKAVVTCIAHGNAAPSCDDAAEAYVKAVGTAPGGFVVTVRNTGGDHCTERYADDGTKR